jgi:hypothetical protein
MRWNTPRWLSFTARGFERRRNFANAGEFRSKRLGLRRGFDLCGTPTID